jgi:hypothetical protein
MRADFQHISGTIRNVIAVNAKRTCKKEMLCMAAALDKLC